MGAPCPPWPYRSPMPSVAWGAQPSVACSLLANTLAQRNLPPPETKSPADGRGTVPQSRWQQAALPEDGKSARAGELLQHCRASRLSTHGSIGYVRKVQRAALLPALECNRSKQSRLRRHAAPLSYSPPPQGHRLQVSVSAHQTHRTNAT